MNGADITEVGRVQSENLLLKTKVQTLEADLAAWRPYIVVKVEQVTIDEVAINEVTKTQRKVGEIPTGFKLRVSIAKPNKKGFIVEIEPNKVTYYLSDPNNLINFIADKIVNELLREEAVNLVKPEILKALSNVSTNMTKLK